MQIFEIKNDIAKITYNPMENHLMPADFILIEDSRQRIISQVIEIATTDSEDYVAMLRLALVIDDSNNLSFYKGSLPSKLSKLYYINPDEIIDLVKGNDKFVYLGNLLNHPDSAVKINSDFLSEKLYILSDKQDCATVINSNLISEIQDKKNKILILDFLGQYDNLKDVHTISISDFKLPLNTSAIDAILENDINDCSLEDKTLIQNILLEVRDYIFETENKFIPFNLFRQVVNEEYKENPLPCLLLLKNKLWLYQQMGLFCDNQNDFDALNKLFKEHDAIVFDLSAISKNWHKYLLQTIPKYISNDYYLFCSVNGLVINKNIANFLYKSEKITPVLSDNYSSKNIEILNAVCKNQILCKPAKQFNTDEPYNFLLNKVNINEFVFYGENSLYLPLLVELKIIDKKTKEELIQNEIKKDVDNLLYSKKRSILTSENEIENKAEYYPEPTKPQPLVVHKTQEEIIQPQIVNEKIETEPQSIAQNDLNVLDEIPETDLNIENNYITDEESVTNNKDDILVPEETEEITENEIIEEEFSDDDLSFLDEIEENNDLQAEIPVSQNLENNVEDSSNFEIIEEQEETENDSEQQTDYLLNFNEEYETNDNAEILALDEYSQEVSEEIKVKSNEEGNEQQSIRENFSASETPIENEPSELVNKNISVLYDDYDLPIYDVKKSENNEIKENESEFKIGDKVFHPKHGKGIIEGFTNYSDKILFCQIQFENVGTRIIDPKISELQKI